MPIPGLEGLLPHAESIWVESLMTNCADGDIAWNLLLTVGYDRDHEIGPQAFFAADITNAGAQRNDAANLSSNYYRQHARVTLEWKLPAGNAAKRGEFSALMFVKTWGM